MLDYDLALKLKRAGFPQNEPGRGQGWLYHPHGKESAYNPSVEELVLACGGYTLLLREFFARQWLAQRGIKT